MSEKIEISVKTFIEDNYFLFREKEVNFLTRFLWKNSNLQYRPLFIYGRNATGKTIILSKLLNYLSKKFVWINCHEYIGPLPMFTEIIRQLAQNEDQKKINNICQFINNLKQELRCISETVYLVFDNAEVYRKESSILPVLTRLQSITKMDICPIFISRLSWDEFIDQNTTIKPLSIFFPNYSKTEMGELLKLSLPLGCKKEFYAGYVNIILKTFFTVSRNLIELTEIAELNFSKYCEPLRENLWKEPSLMCLWKNIEPTLKLAMTSMFLRETPGSIWKIYKDSSEKKNSMRMNVYGACFTRELSLFTKYLLISAYFASFNSQQSDIKHFVKNQGKQAKKKLKKKLVKNRHLLGPKPFTLDRLISIFQSIVGNQVMSAAILGSQISSLVKHNLVTRVSADDKVESATYKCLADLKLVCKIGKTLSFDVMGYLEDFL